MFTLDNKDYEDAMHCRYNYVRVLSLSKYPFTTLLFTRLLLHRLFDYKSTHLL